MFGRYAVGEQAQSVLGQLFHRKHQFYQHHASSAMARSHNLGVADRLHPKQELYATPDPEQPHPDSKRPPHLAAAAPTAPPITVMQLEALVALLQDHKRAVVLTGAGVSTESNIPDYRGPHGAYTTGFTPMTHQQFIASPETRARYWARSFVAWQKFASSMPNAAHDALARLQQLGWISTIITQNVDRLHTKAGARDVLELHGTTHEVVCLSCGTVTCRHQFQQKLSQLNPAVAAWAKQVYAPMDATKSWDNAIKAGTAADANKVVSGVSVQQVPIQRPDGDVELRDAGTNFVVPPCVTCGGVLKPHVVLFGDSLPPERSARALHLAQDTDALLVVGSSLMVYSAFRLAEAAKKTGAQLAILNIGQTRADKLADIKVEVVAGEALMKLASHANMLVPRL